MGADDEEEVVEEVEDLAVSDSAATKPKPRKRMPRRTASSDGITGPMSSGGPRRGRKGDSAALARCNTGDGFVGNPRNRGAGLSPLRRVNTESGRVGRIEGKDKDKEGGDTSTSTTTTSATSTATESPPTPKAEDGGDSSDKNHHKDLKKKNSVSSRIAGLAAAATGASGRQLPGRSKSEKKMGGSAHGPTRATPKRTASGFGRGTPRRAKSNDPSGLSGMVRKGRKKEKAGSSDDTRNIFGSDLVSIGKILEDINDCKEDTTVTKLELEDFFMAEREDPDAIPLALKELLECDDRPWESVKFQDDIMDASIYEEFQERKKNFLRTMAGVCEARLIPVTYRAKITLSSGSLNMEEMCDMLFYLRSDKSVVDLTLKSDKVDEGIIRSLSELFKADKRKWKSVTLQLSGKGPGKPGSAEHNTWAKKMGAATEEMQKVCKERGINLG